MPINPSAIYSKSGKGVQEASGKTSLLSRADRAVLGAFDGKMTVKEVADKVGKPFDQKFEGLIAKLDNDGFVRQVSAGTAAGPASRPGAAPPRAPGKPGGGAPGEDLDFTIAMPAPKPAAPKPAAPPPAPPVAPHMAQSQAAAFAKAREEAEEKAARERERIKAEAEAKMRAEMEANARSEAQIKAKEEAEARVRAEAEAKVKAAREAAVRAAAEAKAKAEAEAERVRREAEEVRRQAEEARRRAEEEARRAREEAEAKARKEAEEVKRQAEEARRKAEEEARRAREEAERIRREAEEAKRQAEEARRQAEEEARKAREEVERKAKEEAERRRKEQEARERAEKEEREARERKEREAHEAEERAEKERRAREKAEREEREREEEELAKQAREAKAAAAGKPAPPASFGDSLLADLDSFSQRDDEERKEKEAQARKEKEEAQRRAEERAEREAKEEAERREKERRREEEARRKEEEERRLREEEERTKEEIRRAQEREREEAERRRAARAKGEAKAGAKAGLDDDIPLSDDDLDIDDVRKDEALLTKEARRAAREREEAERRSKKEAKKEAKRAKKEEKEEKAARREEPPAPPQFRRPRKWGKTVAMTLFLALVAGVGALHVMPLSTAEYESAAGKALGQPVKISSARLSLYSGVVLNMKGVSIGEAKLATVRAYPEIGSLFEPKKSFSRIELDGVTVPLEAFGGLLTARVRSDTFAVERLNAKQVKFSGPINLPALQVDLAFGRDGAITTTAITGPDGLSGRIVPKGAGELEFDIVAHSFTVPIVPDMSLSGFAMKGTATADGMRIESWGGSSLDGGVEGSTNVRWAGGNWNIDGVMTVRGINAAVFAPALLSEGKAEGTGRFSFSDPDPNRFLGRGRIEGTFTVHKGVLGSFDLSRAIQTGGRQAGGRTPFTGMSGQGVFDKGAVALRNVSFGAGALAAGASADISPEGQLSGRIVADVRTPSQTLRATLNLGGTVRDPQVRN